MDLDELARETASDVILDALMRHNPDKQDFATNETELEAVAKIVLSALQEVVKEKVAAYEEQQKEIERLQRALDKADPLGIYDDRKMDSG